MRDQHHCGMHRYRYFLIALYLFSLPYAAHAEIISLEMSKGLVATAEYRQGNSNLPPILVLHGFLQTRDFITVSRLSNSLHESGYTVLLPNLTLGINVRQKSLSCEAIHTHSMEQDLSEISRWIDWLTNKTNKKIVLIGHSAGSLQLNAYLSNHLDPPVAHAIFISLIAYGLGPLANETPADKSKAVRDLQMGPGSLRKYGLAYCKHYLTTPGKYLSYVNWDKTTTLAAIGRIEPPITVILGGNDLRISTVWAETLKTLNLNVIEIEDANHFFDHQHEFDLLESIEYVLGNLGVSSLM